MQAMRSGKPLPGDCDGCGWFYREQAPYDSTGVCMCGARRRGNGIEKERNE